MSISIKRERDVPAQPHPLSVQQAHLQAALKLFHLPSLPHSWSQQSKRSFHEGSLFEDLCVKVRAA